MLEAINDEMCAVPAIEILSKNIASQRIKEALHRNGQLGAIKHISENLNREVTYISSLTMEVLVKRKLIKTLLQSNILGYQ